MYIRCIFISWKVLKKNRSSFENVVFYSKKELYTFYFSHYSYVNWKLILIFKSCVFVMMYKYNDNRAICVE